MTLGDRIWRWCIVAMALVLSVLGALFAARRRTREQVQAERREAERQGQDEAAKADSRAEKEVQDGLDRESLADYVNRSSRG